MENYPFEESDKLIKKFMKENELEPMHFEMYLQYKCGIICRTIEEDNEISEELERLRNE